MMYKEILIVFKDLKFADSSTFTNLFVCGPCSQRPFIVDMDHAIDFGLRSRVLGQISAAWRCIRGSGEGAWRHIT